MNYFYHVGNFSAVWSYVSILKSRPPLFMSDVLYDHKASIRNGLFCLTLLFSLLLFVCFQKKKFKNPGTRQAF